MQSAPWRPAPSPPFGTEERVGERRRSARVTRFAWVGHPSPRPSPRSCLTGRGLVGRGVLTAPVGRPHGRAARWGQTRPTFSLASVRNGGEGWGEEALRKDDTVGLGGAPLSPALSPFVPHGARETDAVGVGRALGLAAARGVHAASRPDVAPYSPSLGRSTLKRHKCRAPPAPSPPFGTEERVGERRRSATARTNARVEHPSPRPSPRSCLTGRGSRSLGWLAGPGLRRTVRLWLPLLRSERRRGLGRGGAPQG